jgi:enolase-phosphatase E1
MTSHRTTPDPTTPDPTTVRARVVVVDLEGTTSAAGFILGDLYDHARPRLGPYLAAHGDEPDIAEARRQAIAEGGLPDDADDDAVVGALHGFMDRDVKSTPLKTIQGRIWADGFAAGELESHFFDDVIPKLRSWTSAGTRLAVFSSGSVTSQRPWFAHSPAGDLTPLVEAYFDTVSAGPKKEPASYAAIASALGAPAGELVFLTDHPDEVRAALAAGWQVVAVDRPGEPWAGSDFGDAPVIASFDELDVVAP